MKKKLNISNILLFSNIIIILVIISFYLIRMVKFYIYENNNDYENTTVSLNEAIKKLQSYVDLTTGLVFNEEDNNYVFKGNIDNNYLSFSGIMYRIVGIDINGNIKAVADNNITLMYYGDKSYDESYVNIYLNKSDEELSGIFEKNIYNTSILKNGVMCADEINDLTNITCNSVSDKNKITLLSLYDYSMAGAKDSYLNNGENFYLSSETSSNNNYYVSSSGDVSTNESKLLGVRPVITIDGKTNLLSGDGSIDNPFVVERHITQNIKDAYVGSYVNINDNIFRIIDINEDNIKVMSDVIKNNEENVNKIFSNKNNVFSLDSDIGAYLNNEYYETIKNDFMVEGTFYTGSYTSNNYDYRVSFERNINTNVGLPSLGDMFICDSENILLINPSYENYKTIFVINDKKNAFKDLISKEYNVRSVFYIKKDINIKSGNGSINSPYILVSEEVSEEGEKTNE